MKLRSQLLQLALLVLVGAVAFAVGRGAPAEPPAQVGAAGETQEEEPTVWTCSMHPQIRMSEPGQCPICGMDLIPAEDMPRDEGDDARISLSQRARALAEIRTAEVSRSSTRGELELLGHVDYDETRMRTVTAWTAGRIDRLRVRVTGARIGRGQVIASLYSPEVYTAFSDLVTAARQARELSNTGLHGSGELAEHALSAAREKLRLLGVPDAQIERVEQSAMVPRHVDIRSPFAGTVLQRMVEEGQYVRAGSPLFQIADLSQVWVQIEAYETDLPYLKEGQTVTVEVQSLPDRAFTGRVAFIDPVVDEQQRTARVRVEVENPDGELRPGMFAEATVQAESGLQDSLTIPASAPLFTGRRSVVYVEVPGTERPTYEARTVQLGTRAGPVYPVLSGLHEGDRVVVQGAFVIDADLQLQGGKSMMSPQRARTSHDELTVPKELRSDLRPVMEAYLQLQARLVDDDAEGAKKVASTLAEATAAVRLLGPEATRDAWQAIASEMRGHARHAAMSPNLPQQRNAFEKLSKAAEQLLRRLGNPLSATLRTAHCPMAFDSRGAGWVQRDGELKNPYYGAAMLGCGELRASFPGQGAGASADTEAKAKPSRGKAKRAQKAPRPAKKRTTPPAPAPAAPVDHSQHQHHQHQDHAGH
ncbi:MAG: efflux RND transporter periplasmic adaptor subunit [Myxococcales bacterium]|jgi:Cu(I)/Ag(I) efflux system membrane fusion protein